MGCTIGHLVFGVSLYDNPAILKAVLEQHRVDNEESSPEDESKAAAIAKEYGFDSTYSGNGRSPLWFGVNFGSISNCRNVRIHDIPQLTGEQRSEAIRKLASLPLIIQDAVRQVGMDTWILWGSS